MVKNKWWGYISINNKLQVKRFFDQKDINEAMASDFVKEVYGPWECPSRREALYRLYEDFKNARKP